MATITNVIPGFRYLDGKIRTLHIMILMKDEEVVDFLEEFNISPDDENIEKKVRTIDGTEVKIFISDLAAA